MQARVAEWEAEYEAESPGDLITNVADVYKSGEIEARRKTARGWKNLADRLPVVTAPLKEYDWATDRDGISA